MNIPKKYNGNTLKGSWRTGCRESENRVGCGGGVLRGLSLSKSQGAPTVAPSANKSPVTVDTSDM